MNITVAGVGYVGLAAAVLLAQHNKVIAFDISEEKVNLINRHISPIEDREIKDYLSNRKLNLSATGDKTKAYAGADYIIIATSADYDADTKHFDTTSLESVIQDINAISPGAAVVIKSTVPIGFTERICAEFPGLSVIFSPEFLREGKALYDNLFPSRIVIGGSGPKAHEFAGLLLQGAVKKNIPVCFMPPSEAEAVKLFSNTYLALRIAFFNELDTYAELSGLNTKSIIDGVCHDPRIGDFYNNPSFGYGGYCLPKDTRELRASYSRTPNSLIAAIVNSNRIRKKHITAMIRKMAPETVGIYKLTMKAGSDNFRYSAVTGIIKYLQDADIKTILFEPLADKTEIFDSPVINDFDEFIEKSDIVLANRMSDELNPVKNKVYTRDIFFRD